MCFNADTGKLLWEYKFNVFQSDVPAHRVGWASPAADPETGNVYSLRRQQPADRAHQRRQEAVGAFHHGRVFAVHHARRTHGFADRSTATW